MTLFFKNHSIQIFLSSAIICTILSVYTPWIPLIALGVIAVNTVVFYFCAYVNEQDKGQEKYLIGLLLVILFSGGMMLFTKIEGFFEIITTDSINTATLIFLLVVSCFAVSSATFYFTNVRFRSFMLVLLIFIPCTLYAKQFKQVPLVYIVVIIICYFANMIDCNKKALSQSAVLLENKKYGRYILTFVLILAALVSAMPKANTTPFDYFKSQIDFSDYNNLGSYNKESGSNNGNQAERLVMRVTADEPLYLKDQVFGTFNGKTWTSDINGTTTPFTEQMYSNYNAEALSGLIAKACELDSDFAAKYKLTADSVPQIDVALKTATIEHVNFPNVFVSHPDITFSIQLQGAPLDSYVTANGEIIISNKETIDPNAKHLLSYFEQNPTAIMPLIELFNSYSSEEYLAFLTDLNGVYQKSGDKTSQEIVKVFIEETTQANSYLELGRLLIPEKIHQIAQEITAGMTGDYEKAVAIEQYFHDPANGFVYDMKYQPPKEYVDDAVYFVTESKAGTCSHYATAMTLMGRSIGLNIRYVEGFYTGLPDLTGVYQVTTMLSHAYPEVFVAGYGWMVFEPTVSYVSENTPQSGSGFNFHLENYEIMTVALLAVLVLLGMAFLIKIFVVPFGKERIFRVKVKSAPNLKGLTLIYSKLIKLISIQQKTDVGYFTPEMLADFAQKHYKVDLSQFVNLYEQAVFNAQTISKKEFRVAYKSYKATYPQIRRRQRRMAKSARKLKRH